MKKILLPVLLAALPLFAAAQGITASPLEGRWTWNGKGDDDLFTEMIFFGNVLLGKYDNNLSYQGHNFTYTERTITFDDGDGVWQYRVSGNTLTITDGDGGRFTYVKATITKSPLEGIWKLTGGWSYDADVNRFYLFIGDIYAVGEESYYDGRKIILSGNRFYLAHDGYGYDKEEFAEYTVSENTLTIKIDDEELTFMKMY